MRRSARFADDAGMSSRKASLIGLCVVAVVSGVGGITYAAVAPAPPTVYACTNAAGTLRLLSSGTCAVG